MKHQPEEVIDSSKRRFFRSFLARSISLVDEARGKPQMSIAELDRVPPEVFEKIVPSLNKETDWRIEGNEIRFVDRQTGHERVVRTFDAEEMFVVSQFDGVRTISQVTDELRTRTGEDRQECYGRVRKLFLALAGRMLYLPISAHER